MRIAFSLLLLLPLTHTEPSGRKLLLISLDGFRHDLLTEKLVPNIYKFATESSWFVNGVKSQMLTVTSANHMSIVTGLRENEHGIIGNIFWDRKKHALYDKFNATGDPVISADSDRSKWTETLGRQIDPIWLLNQKNGGKSTAINWPVGDYERSEQAGVIRTRYRPEYFDNSNWPGELQLVIDSLATNNLVMWYIAEPDSTLHKYGFNGGQLENKLKQLDALFDSLIKRMDEKGLLTNTDIILTADHGHIQVQPGKTLCLNEVLDEFTNDPDCHIADSNIYHSNPEKVQKIYALLNRAIESHNLPYKVHLQKDIPDSWYYVNAERTGDIVIELLPGGQIKMCYGNYDDSHSSSHGQNPNLKEMRALLVLSGTSFKRANTITSIPENIDLFPLMNRLLGIEGPRHNGNMSRLCKAIRKGNLSIHCDEYSTTPSLITKDSSTHLENVSREIRYFMSTIMTVISMVFIIN